MWSSAYGGFPNRDRRRSGADVVGLLLTSMRMALLGALLALSPRPLYAHIESGPHFTPLDDQHLDREIMQLAVSVAYLTGGLRQ